MSATPICFFFCSESEDLAEKNLQLRTRPESPGCEIIEEKLTSIANYNSPKLTNYSLNIARCFYKRLPFKKFLTLKSKENPSSYLKRNFKEIENGDFNYMDEEIVEPIKKISKKSDSLRTFLK